LIGAGLGQAGIGGAVDKVLEIAGVKKPRGLVDTSVEAGKDIIDGAISEGTGQSLGAFKEVLPKVGRSIYGKAMRIPPASLKDETRDAVYNTMFKEKLPIGNWTRAKMNDVISVLDDDITYTLKGLSTKGEASSIVNKGPFYGSTEGSSIDIKPVLDTLDSLKAKYANSLDAKAYIQAIDTVKDKLVAKTFKNNGRMTLIDANDLKKGIYRDIQDYYYKVNKAETGRIGIQTDIDAVAQSKAASAIRDAIISHPDVPKEIVDKMSREAGLMNARKWVERAVNRGNNLDLLSLDGMVFGVLAEGGVPSAIAYKIAKSQPVMSRLGLWVGKDRKIPSATSPSRLIPFELMESLRSKDDEIPVIKGSGILGQ